jgi:hypothetical protein
MQHASEAAFVTEGSVPESATEGVNHYTQTKASQTVN